MLRATVSGSFHRHLGDVDEAVRELHALGVEVLSPADPRIVDAHGDFLFVASDRHRSVRLVQDRHLSAIALADFVWLTCPDGYVGPSAAMEIGFAAGVRTPVFAAHAPIDLTMRAYVRVVRDVRAAVLIAQEEQVARPSTSLLLDPETALANVARSLDEMRRLLRGEAPVAPDRLATEVFERAQRAAQLLGQPRGR